MDVVSRGVVENALDFRMFLVAEKDQRSFRIERGGFFLKLDDERTYGIRQTKVALFRRFLRGGCDAMRAEECNGTDGNGLNIVNENRAFFTHGLRDDGIVDEFVEHVDWFVRIFVTHFFKCSDGMSDTATETKRFGEKEFFLHGGCHFSHLFFSRMDSARARSSGYVIFRLSEESETI